MDDQPELASKFSMMSIPAWVVLKNGKIVQQVSGARPKEAILAMIYGDVFMGRFVFFKQADINQGIEED